MSFKKFNPTCPCCCFKNLAVICIYDESNPIYTDGNTYVVDKTQWQDFIDSLKKSTVVMGLIKPFNESSIKKHDESWPYDSIGEIIVDQLPARPNPRVLADDIYNMFVDLKANLDINLVVFCLDNSGSIVVSSYKDELDEAKRRIKENYSKVKILDDLSNEGERWLLDAKNSAYKRTCG